MSVAAASGSPQRPAAHVSCVVHPSPSSHAAKFGTWTQPSIGSQLVDNLNASTHLRAVLTDLFLLAEILKV